jgi:hypothetical protein
MAKKTKKTAPRKSVKPRQRCPLDGRDKTEEAYGAGLKKGRAEAWGDNRAFAFILILVSALAGALTGAIVRMVF